MATEKDEKGDVMIRKARAMSDGGGVYCYMS